MNEFSNLLEEYRDSRRKARKLLKTCQPEEVEVVNSMISDLTYAIEWLEKGFDSTSHRKAIYKQGGIGKPIRLIEEIVDTKDFTETLFDEQQERQLTDTERYVVSECLRTLTQNQMNAFLLHTAHFRTFDEIAAELNIQPTTVQTHIERARKKVSSRLKELEHSGQAI